MEEENNTRSFYNSYEAWNEDGLNFLREVELALDTIIKKWSDNGFGLRQMEGAIGSAAFGRMSYVIVKRAMERRKKERLAKENNQNINTDQNKENDE